MNKKSLMITYLQKLGFVPDFQADKIVCKNGTQLIMFKRKGLVERHYIDIKEQLELHGYNTEEYYDMFLKKKPKVFNTSHLKNADFKKYYDSTRKIHIWVLGYFGGGRLNVSDTMKLAEEFAYEYKVDIKSVFIDEIMQSRRFKGFKYLYSTETQDDPIGNPIPMIDVFNWLYD